MKIISRVIYAFQSQLFLVYQLPSSPQKMARSTSIAYYPKLDGLAEELDELGSDIQAMKNGVCVVSVQTSAGVDVLANAQVTTEVQKQEERYRILFFNWTNEVCQVGSNFEISSELNKL